MNMKTDSSIINQVKPVPVVNKNYTLMSDSSEYKLCQVLKTQDL